MSLAMLILRGVSPARWIRPILAFPLGRARRALLHALALSWFLTARPGHQTLWTCTRRAWLEYIRATKQAQKQYLGLARQKREWNLFHAKPSLGGATCELWGWFSALWVLIHPREQSTAQRSLVRRKHVHQTMMPGRALPATLGLVLNLAGAYTPTNRALNTYTKTCPVHALLRLALHHVDVIYTLFSVNNQISSLSIIWS